MTSLPAVGPSPPTREPLRLRLLGPPGVAMGDTALTIPRRQVRALLYYLAAAGEPVPRERLAFLFWPDTPETDARRSLTRLLTHLRRALPREDLLQTEDDCVGLDPDGVVVDLVAFERLAEREDDVAALRRAADLYRGAFLDGFSLPGSPEYEGWLVTQQRACEVCYLGVLSALIDACGASGDHDAAIAAARRYLATDELAEDVHRRLIALYAAAGDRAAALGQFERCAAVLERELGVRPLPETRAAYESVLQSRPLPPACSPRELAWTTLPSLSVPLVGRETAMRVLQAALADAEAGRGCVVLVSGEPGIGKSRLLEAFATRARDRALVLAAAARSVERALPYQPVADAIRTLSSWEPLDTLPPVWLAEASRVLPDLRDLRPGLPAPLPVAPQEARTRLLEALSHLLLRLAEGPKPLLLCLDDLQWADSATLDWLVHLAPRLADRRVLIVAAYRSEERARVEGLRRALSRLGQRRELHLAGLGVEDVAQIVRRAVGRRGDPDALSRQLHRATGGNPFFLLELLRAILEGHRSGEPIDLSSEELPLPDSLREAIEARLRRLSPAAKQILEAGAILGCEFDFGLVRRVAGRGEIEAVDGLEEAVARQIIEPEDNGYRFHHALIRQAVEASLSPLRCHLLHRRAARSLVQREPKAVGRIARHFDLGGEAAKALRYYAEAAAGAQALYAWEEAEWIQGRMLALLDQLDPAHAHPDYRVLRGQILTERAHLRFLQGRLEARDADLAALAGLAEATDDDPLRLLMAVHRVRYHNLGGDYTEAIAEAEAHLPLARRLGDAAAVARLLAHAGFARYFLGQPELAITALESATEAAGGEMDGLMQGRILHILGYVHYHLGNYPRALDYHQEAYACSREAGDHNRMAWNLMDAGFLLLKLGRAAEARECLEESLAVARCIAARPAEAYALTLLADWELHDGSYAVALDGYRASLALQEAVDSQHGMLAAEDGAGFAFYHLGDLEAAREAFGRALDRARAISHQRHIGTALSGLALVEIGVGTADGLSRAEARLVEALAVAQTSRCAENEAAALAALACVRRQQGDAAGAFDRAQEAAAVAEAHGFETCLAWAESEAGRALLAMGEPEAARAYTARAVERLPHADEAWIGTEALHRAHARVLATLGLDDEARAQTDLAEGVVQSKADRIPDPELRRRYVRWAHRAP